jgi:hypothetical protein
MIPSFIEPFNKDIIKVTIKDKPALCQPQGEDNLKEVFEALKQYAIRERNTREVIIRINERISKRKLRHYFKIWHNYCKKLRQASEYAKKEKKISNEKRIELLVNAIAECQKKKNANHEKAKCQKRSTETKSAPQHQNKTPGNKQKRATSRGVKVEEVPGAPVQNRLKAQKMIIEEQKAKLAEQKKFIEEMKLIKINKEAKETNVQNIKVAKQVLNKCDQKTKRSLIHLMKEQGYRFIILIYI